MSAKVRHSRTKDASGAAGGAVRAEDRRTRLMFVTHSAQKGGAEQSLIHLINYVDRTRYRVYLVCPPDTAYAHELNESCTLVPLALPSVRQGLGLGYVRAVLRLRRFVRETGIELIHANGWRAPWYVAPLRLMRGVKLIWHHRDHTDSRLFNRVLPTGFDQVVCISEFVASALPRARKRVIYNGVDAARWPDRPRRGFMEDGELVIGTFGRIVEWKRYDLMIEACRQLAEHAVTNWRLRIVGSTAMDGTERYLERLRRQAERAGIADRVEFAGHDSRPLEAMSACDVTINFSDREPFGRVIIESLLTGTPVIVADSGGAPEVVRRTGGGLIVGDGDEAALADALRRLHAAGAEAWEALSAQGRAGVREHFDMARVSEQVDRLYGELLERRPPGRRRAAPAKA
ncbi:glycosyltransferase [Paenibacillus sp. IB182496]|uniref:Glycosyltransferase n=1 Tax=Paenibacillus sabuli TaxID=2772509 RepID=A0A927C074_9BACL|nr:glycosyltransferase [Paenibacillus sabuli]MBD2848589.1 glycosyltransferase [Paenibacillus sabuli]